MPTKDKRKAPPFEPKRDPSLVVPALCWTVLLAHPKLPDWLRSWRFLWVLPQVFGRRAIPRPDEWMHRMCACDDAQTFLLWKKKANDLFGLTARELEDLPFRPVRSKYYRRSEVHLLRRAPVLKLALEKHGNSFAAINNAFLKRAERKSARNGARAKIFGL